MTTRNRYWAAVLALLGGAALAGEDFGMVMDMQGKAGVVQQGKSTPISLGQTLFLGDKLSLEAKARLIVVAFSTCDEIALEGPVAAEVTPGGVKATQGNAPKAVRRLPVCYSQEEINTGNSGVIGGLVLRGAPKDPVFDLRQEFEAGKSTTSSLMTLILHDLANGHPDQARPYFEALRARAPDSRFVAEMKPHFAP